jgi:hypothetical protein
MVSSVRSVFVFPLSRHFIDTFAFLLKKHPDKAILPVHSAPMASDRHVRTRGSPLQSLMCASRHHGMICTLLFKEAAFGLGRSRASGSIGRCRTTGSRIRGQCGVVSVGSSLNTQEFEVFALISQLRRIDHRIRFPRAISHSTLFPYLFASVLAHGTNHVQSVGMFSRNGLHLSMGGFVAASSQLLIS